MIFLKKEFKSKDFFRGKGVRDATVSDFFFYKESKSKKIKKFCFLFFRCWGGGG